MPIFDGEKMNGTLAVLSKVCPVDQLADIFIVYFSASIAIFILEHCLQSGRNGFVFNGLQCYRCNPIVVLILLLLPFLASLPIHVIIKPCWGGVEKFDLFYLRDRFTCKHSI